MKSYLIRLSDREEGPYSDAQIAQMFADRLVSRYTPCKLATGGNWKTIDDFLPTLKYGTQLPAETPQIVAPAPSAPRPAAFPADFRVSVVDLDIPFGSILKIIFKWMAAGVVVMCCLLPVIMALWFLAFAAVVSFLSQLLPNSHP